MGNYPPEPTPALSLWSRSRSFPTSYLTKAICGDSLALTMLVRETTLGTSLGWQRMSNTSPYEASFHLVCEDAYRYSIATPFDFKWIIN